VRRGISECRTPLRCVQADRRCALAIAIRWQGCDREISIATHDAVCAAPHCRVASLDAFSDAKGHASRARTFACDGNTRAAHNRATRPAGQAHSALARRPWHRRRRARAADAVRGVHVARTRDVAPRRRSADAAAPRRRRAPRSGDRGALARGGVFGGVQLPPPPRAHARERERLRRSHHGDAPPVQLCRVPRRDRVRRRGAATCSRR